MPNDEIEETNVILRNIGDVKDISTRLPNAIAMVNVYGTTLFIASYADVSDQELEDKLSEKIKVSGFSSFLFYPLLSTSGFLAILGCYNGS